MAIVGQTLTSEIGANGSYADETNNKVRQKIRAAQAEAESVAANLKGVSLADQEIVNKRSTKQVVKQGRKVLDFVRDYQPDDIADNEQLLRIKELTKKLEAAEHAHKRLMTAKASRTLTITSLTICQESASKTEPLKLN